MANKLKSTTLNQLSFMADLDTTKIEPFIVFHDDKRFSDFIKDWKASKFFGLDIETKNISIEGEGLNHYKGKIRLIQISLPLKEEVLIIDMDGVVPLVFLDTLKETCESHTQHQVGAFIQFDLVWLQQQLGIQSNKPYDIRILSILLWCGIKWDGNTRKRFSHSLKDIYSRLFGIELDKESQVSDWSQPRLTNTQLNYAGMDAKVILPCFRKLSMMLQEYDNKLDLTGRICSNKLTEIAKIECFAIPMFVEIILTGQPIDLELAVKVRQQYVDAIDDLYQPVMDAINLPYSASCGNLAGAIWAKFGILLTEEVVSFDEEGNKEDQSDVVRVSQLNILGKPMPQLPKNTKLSTGSANLFYYYTQTNNDILIRISLARSLKKSIDSIDALVASAESIDGYAKGRYTSLGSTGSGRSTCAGDKKSSLPQTNLQNIAGTISHPLLDKYKLPKIRSIITNKVDRGMWLVDLSASHLRIAAYNSEDTKLVEILSYKDPHSLLTSKMLAMDGKYPAGSKNPDSNRQYCEANKSLPEVSYYRDIAKVALYTQFNDGKAPTFQASLLKAFVSVTLEDCQKAKDALGETFPGYSAYANRLAYFAGKSVVETPYGKFVRYRTHDGRLFHVEARERTSFKGDQYISFKRGEVTSSMLISPEALAMKKAGVKILEFLRENRHLPIKLSSFTHDDFSGEDCTEDKVFVKFAYNEIATEFHTITGGEANSGMPLGDEYAIKTVINNYSEK